MGRRGRQSQGAVLPGSCADPVPSREEFLGEAEGGGWLGGWVLPVLIQPHPSCQAASPLPGLFAHL